MAKTILIIHTDKSIARGLRRVLLSESKKLSEEWTIAVYSENVSRQGAEEVLAQAHYDLVLVKAECENDEWWGHSLIREKSLEDRAILTSWKNISGRQYDDYGIEFWKEELTDPSGLAELVGLIRHMPRGAS